MPCADVLLAQAPPHGRSPDDDRALTVADNLASDHAAGNN
jgi:hypothetical protein